jgi:hypothetical protein
MKYTIEVEIEAPTKHEAERRLWAALAYRIPFHEYLVLETIKDKNE